MVAHILVPYLIPIYVLFGFADWVSTGESLYKFLLFRMFVAFVSVSMYYALRGRVKYGIRHFFLYTPYLLSIEYMLIRYDLIQTPYLSGLALISYVGTIFWPLSLRIVIPIYTLSFLPIFIYILHEVSFYNLSTFLPFVMLFGMYIIAIVSSSKSHRELQKRYFAEEALSVHVKEQDGVIADKTKELVTRKFFECQFSPQVVNEVLTNPTSIQKMHRNCLVILVCDIVNSTYKATVLPPLDYKTVIEEVFDVVSAVCLQWNITIDRFTGDGVQVFAGSPTKQQDDFYRVYRATSEIYSMIYNRKDNLEQLWQGPLEIRYAISEGPALVGFLGIGAMKSYTAIGDVVSFTHRLCAKGADGDVLLYSFVSKVEERLNLGSSEIEIEIMSNLKGFERVTFEVLRVKLKATESVDIGRCEHCNTPLIVEESANGLPKVICPACSVKVIKIKAVAS